MVSKFRTVVRASGKQRSKSGKMDDIVWSDGAAKAFRHLTCELKKRNPSLYTEIVGSNSEKLETKIRDAFFEYCCRIWPERGGVIFQTLVRISPFLPHTPQITPYEIFIRFHEENAKLWKQVGLKSIPPYYIDFSNENLRGATPLYRAIHASHTPSKIFIDAFEAKKLRRLETDIRHMYAVGKTLDELALSQIPRMSSITFDEKLLEYIDRAREKSAIHSKHLPKSGEIFAEVLNSISLEDERDGSTLETVARIFAKYFGPVQFERRRN